MELQTKNAEEDSPNRTVGIWVGTYFKESGNMISLHDIGDQQHQ